MKQALDIYLNETKVGLLVRLSDGRVLFTFDETYIASKNHPILSQCYYSAERELLSETRAYRTKAPPFFSNLLPEGHLREYLAQRGCIKENDEFSLLYLLGEDLPGAVIAKPADREISSNAERDLDTKKVAHEEDMPLRFSLAGVQLKFSALMDRQGGLTIPASGMGGDWIVKLPSATHDNVPENEFAMMHMAGEIGIPVPEIKLVKLSHIQGLPDFGKLRGEQALAVKRFDRTSEGKRIHIEDFAQVYNMFPDKKYEGVSFQNIASMIWTLTGEEGLRDFIARLTYTVLTGNGDMHLKNWSFIYQDGCTPELSPAYDMVSTVPYIPDDDLALKMVGTRNMSLCDLRLFEKMAEKSGVPKKLVLDTAHETADKTRNFWAENKKHYDLPSDIASVIDKHMKDVPV